MRFSEPRGRTAAELLIMTERVGVCPCVFQLDGRMREDIDSVAAFAAAGQALGVRVTFPPVRTPSKGASAMLFDVPDNLQDVPKAFNSDLRAPSMETVLHHALLDAQRQISICACGSLTGRRSNVLAGTAASANGKTASTEQEISRVSRAFGTAQPFAAQQPGEAGATPMTAALEGELEDGIARSTSHVATATTSMQEVLDGRAARCNSETTRMMGASTAVPSMEASFPRGTTLCDNTVEFAKISSASGIDQDA